MSKVRPLFTKIKRRLVLLNALVFFLILCLFGSSLYLYMEYRLFSQVDAALNETASRLQQGHAGEMMHGGMGRAADRRISFLFWNSQGQLVGQFPEQVIYEDDVDKFRPSPGEHAARSVKVEEREYRVLSLPSDSIESFPFGGGPGGFMGGGPGGQNGRLKLPSGQIQLVQSQEPEQEMLNSLFWVIVTGILAGAFASVIVGMYLAARSLVPIRISWEKQQQFVADASHELRTPLAVLQANSELLLRHPAHTIEQESPTISAIYKETKRMGKLVSELLTLARTDSNQLELQVKPVSLEQVLRETEEQFRPLAELRDIRLTSALDCSLLLEADEGRLRQLFVILLDNALKYTPDGQQINLSCKKLPHAVEILVADTGIGIAAEDLPRIFERFYRSDKVRTRSDGGTGLGLSIAKWIVEAHGGTIRADSQLGRGTEIRIQLPIRK